MYINFLKYTKFYFIFSGTLILASLICLVSFGLNLGLDFTGGSILEVEWQKARPSNQVIRDCLKDIDLGEVLIQPTREKGVILRMKDIPESTHQQILQKLREQGQLEERRFESIGPVIGRELKQKTKIVALLSLAAIITYIALAFRRVQRPIKSWRYGVASLIALFHDVLIPLGIFSILGKFYAVQINIPIIVALITVLGYSINDSVVVFDRIRENLLKRIGVDFADTVNKSLNQTLTRSINTSLTTALVLVAIFFFGGQTLTYFALALLLGIAAGTYSSIFLASPILISWWKWKR